MDAFSPFPVEGWPRRSGHEIRLVPLFTLLGGIAGGLGGYFMEWYSMGRFILLTWVADLLIAGLTSFRYVFELTILIASFSAFTAMLMSIKLPQPHHPVLTCRSSGVLRLTAFSSASKWRTRNSTAGGRGGSSTPSRPLRLAEV